MSDHTIRELYRSLERTIHERLCVLDEARGDGSFNPRDMFSNLEATIRDRLKVIETVLAAEPRAEKEDHGVEERLSMRFEVMTAVMQDKLNRLYATVETLRGQVNLNVPVSLIPPTPLQGIEVIPKREVVPEPISVADRLLLNKSALKALEEEDGEVDEDEEDVELQLEEFEYRGATYYRDPDDNVYMTDEDGELVQEVIGTWSDAKQRIIVKKPDA